MTVPRYMKHRFTLFLSHNNKVFWIYDGYKTFQSAIDACRDVSDDFYKYCKVKDCSDNSISYIQIRTNTEDKEHKQIVVDALCVAEI